jgi:hypothetical protein
MPIDAREDDTEFSAGRRDYDIRLRRLEDLVQALDKIVAVTDVRVQGLMQTLDSRFKAFDHGQSLILAKLNETSPLAVTSALAGRIKELEDIKAQATGAIWLARLLGITGIIGGVIGIVRMIRG